MKSKVLIMGSGLGGLVCGYILSKNGYEVVVLEKNNQIGGCLQTFSRKGTKFNTGMHYMGSMEPKQLLYRFFNYLNLLNDVKISKLDPNGYEVISISGNCYKYASGYKNFTEELAKQFPNHRKEIQLYVQKIQEIANSSPLYNLHEINNQKFIEIDPVKISVNEFFDSITKNKQLRDVLAGTLPLYAGIRDKTPAYIHALINNFYIQSAFRIVGGSDTIANSLTNSIQSFGGKVITNAEVVKINCDSEKVTSVQLSNGDVHVANYLISNVHPHVTLEKIDSSLIRKAYRIRIAEMENTISNFTVYIKFKENATPYLNYNYYYYEHDDVWKNNDYDAKKTPESYLYMHQCITDKDIFADSAKIIGYMRYDEMTRWKGTTTENRGNEYLEFKEEKAYKLLQKLEESFPGINEAIDSYYTSTPLTYRDYTATKEGAMYGIVRDKSFPARTFISHRTKISNLFMTGQNTNFHGILGVTIGAIITCAEFLGINSIIKQIEEANHKV
jgi:all-trans-retinol 13,14-reductase